MASQYEDDESDSSFLASRRRPAVVSRGPPCLEEDEPDENKPLDLRRMIPSYHHQTPVAVIQRRAPTTSILPPRVAHVTSKSKSPSSNNRKIAKVVDSLLLKKRQTAVKKPAQYRAILLANLNKLETDKKEEEASDEVEPNLDWLTQFNIASTPGFVPLSPPQSPLVTTSTALASRKAAVEEDDECDSTRLHLAKRARLAINSPSSSSTALKKPNITFSCLAFFAIESAPRKRLSVKEIYTWVIENYPYFGNVPSGSWKNSIRHNLASNACFSKVDKNLLAMRDFSGKGSLWCMSPFYRPTLLDALARFGGDRAKLAAANIPCLQDVREQPPPHVVTVAPRTSHERHHSQPASSGSGFRSRSASSLIYNAYPKPTLNPRLLVGGGGPATVSRFLTDSSLSKGAKSHVTITNVSKLSKSSMGLNQAQTSAAANQQHLNDNYSELDAVKALLSMKSRSSSSSAPVSTTSVLTTTATTSSNADQKQPQQEEQPKRGRRKQVFKRPVKAPAIEHDHDNEFGSPKSDEIDLGDLDEQNDDDDDYEADDDDEIDINDIYPSLSSQKTLKSSSKRAAKHGNQYMCNNNSKPKPGKLLVKFTSFHNKPTTSKGEKFDEKEKRSNDIESDEESRLRIDDDDDESQTAANNPLLELSRAAYLVEEKTNTKK